MNEPLLNQSEFVNAYFVPIEDRATMICQLCSLIKSKKEMYSVSLNCAHLFCLPCLVRQLEDRLKANEDMCCPIDYCPNQLEERSNFFMNLPNSVHNKFVKWKSSSAYLRRNQSIRESSQQLFENDNEHKNNYEDNPIIKNEFRNGYFNPRDTLERLSEHFVEEPPRYFNPPIIPQEQPAPIYVPEPPQVGRIINDNLSDRKANEGLVFVPYTCSKRIVKFLYVGFLLPFMFLVMAILLTLTFAIYILFVVSFVGILGSLASSIYFLVISFEEENEKIKDELILYSGLLFGLSLFCCALARCFTKTIKDISYLIVKNSWIWWIHQIIKIWAYPSPAPIVYLGPRVSPDRLHEIVDN